LVEIINKESLFSWVSIEDAPANRLLKIIAKTTKSTDHREDISLPLKERTIRHFNKEDLALSARSLRHKPVGWQHGQLIESAYAIDSEWNPIEEQVEAILYVPEKYVQMVKEGKIVQCSVEYSFRSEKLIGNESYFEGLCLERVDLLGTRLEAGDSNAQVMLYESAAHRGKFLCESIEVLKAKIFVEKVVKRGDQYCVVHCHGADAGKTIKCFPTKGQAIAMHQAIQIHKKESVETPKIEETPKVEPVTPAQPVQKVPEKPVEIPKLPEKIPEKPAIQDKKPVDEPVNDSEIEEFAKKVREHPDLIKKVSDLEGAIANLQKAVKVEQTGKSKAIDDAKKEAVAEVVSKFKKVLPDQITKSRMSAGGQKLYEEIYKLVRTFE